MMRAVVVRSAELHHERLKSGSKSLNNWQVHQARILIRGAMVSCSSGRPAQTAPGPSQPSKALAVECDS